MSLVKQILEQRATAWEQAKSLLDTAEAEGRALTAEEQGQFDTINDDLTRLDAQRQSIANQYALGLGNLGLGYQNSGQNYALGLGQLGLGQVNSDRSYTLGLGNQALQGQQIANSYDLGLRGVDFNYANLDRQINNDNVANQLAGANFGLGLYDRLMTGNNAALAAGAQIQNAPASYYGQFSNQANSIGQGYGTASTTATAQGNPYLGALGGLQLGSALAKNLGLGS